MVTMLGFTSNISIGSMQTFPGLVRGPGYWNRLKLALIGWNGLEWAGIGWNGLELAGLV